MTPSTDKPSIIIAGGRTFNDYDSLKDTLDEILTVEDFEVVSGGARGVDALGERYAKEKGHSVKLFPADWDKHGKAAGPIRNEEMAKYADGLVAFWDGSSRGTASMIKKAEKHNLEIKVIRYE
jgi:ABC-type enterochelin transport system substrate-binding protein